jgi:hypothetical protein
MQLLNRTPGRDLTKSIKGVVESAVRSSPLLQRDERSDCSEAGEAVDDPVGAAVVGEDVGAAMIVGEVVGEDVVATVVGDAVGATGSTSVLFYASSASSAVQSIHTRVVQPGRWLFVNVYVVLNNCPLATTDACVDELQPPGTLPAPSRPHTRTRLSTWRSRRMTCGLGQWATSPCCNAAVSTRRVSPTVVGEAVVDAVGATVVSIRMLDRSGSSRTVLDRSKSSCPLALFRSHGSQ